MGILGLCSGQPPLCLDADCMLCSREYWVAFGGCAAVWLVLLPVGRLAFAARASLQQGLAGVKAANQVKSWRERAAEKLASWTPQVQNSGGGPGASWREMAANQAESWKTRMQTGKDAAATRLRAAGGAVGGAARRMRMRKKP